MKLTAFLLGMIAALSAGFVLALNEAAIARRQAAATATKASKDVRICESNLSLAEQDVEAANEAAESAKADLYRLEFTHFETLAECAEDKAALREIRLMEEQKAERRRKRETKETVQ